MSWIQRNPVQVGSIFTVILGIVSAVQDGAADFQSISLWLVAVLTGGPAAVRSRFGQTSNGGWLKN